MQPPQMARLREIWNPFGLQIVGAKPLTLKKSSLPHFLPLNLHYFEQNMTSQKWHLKAHSSFI